MSITLDLYRSRTWHNARPTRQPRFLGGGARPTQRKGVIAGLTSQLPFAADICDWEARPSRAQLQGRGGDAPTAGDRALRFNLHQTLATSDDLIPLGYRVVAKLTSYETSEWSEFVIEGELDAAGTCAGNRLKKSRLRRSADAKYWINLQNV